MSHTPFTKAQGAGNDFLIVEIPPDTPIPSPEWRRQICDRHYGVGADGILFVTVPASTPGADADLRICNSDGGEVEISGNGTRCAAAFLVEAHRLGPRLVVQTGAGPKQLQLIARQENRFEFEMEMGTPIFSAPLIPFQPSFPTIDSATMHASGLPSSSGGISLGAPIAGFALPLSSRSWAVTVTSMGNPHCSVLVDDFDWDWMALGAEIETHRYFPNRTNVEFYRPISAHEIEVRFWERGVGFTLSSGTGSCAATIAAVLGKHVESPVTVKTLAGDLGVRWDSEGVILKGPAEIICHGEFFGGNELLLGPTSL